MSSDIPDQVVAIDASLVRRLIAAQFPEWGHLPITSVDPGGWDNRTFRLGEAMSVRFPSRARYVPQVEKEHRWLPELAPQLPLPIPLPLARGAPGEGYPWPWSVYAWLDGAPAEREAITDLDHFAWSLANFLLALYRIDARSGPAAGQHNFHRGGRLSAYDAETKRALEALDGRIDVSAAAKIWNRALASEWRGKLVWVHGDVAWGNLLVKDDRLSGVIDFGSSAVGDPACDLVIAWTFFEGSSRKVFRESMGLDDDTWDRARGWALWKALITVANYDDNQREIDNTRRVLDVLLSEA